MTITTIRQGLPRTPGEGPWPPVSEAETALAVAAAVSPAPAPAVLPAEPAEPTEPAVAEVAAPVAAAAMSVAPAQVVAATPQVRALEHPLRRGLPRVPGGEPWPPAAAVASAPAARPVQAPTHTAVDDQPVADSAPSVAASVPAPSAVASALAVEMVTEEVALRRGLPRVPGGEPWPTVGSAKVAVARAVPANAEPEPAEVPAPVTEPAATAAVPGAAVAGAGVAAAAVTGAVKAADRGVDKQEKQRDPRTVRAIGAVLGLVALGAVAMVLARWFLGSAAGQGFIERYPGHAPMPGSAPVGVPAWLAWSHFFNLFLIVLIIRSGLQIRGERRPPAYFTPRGGRGGKISLTIWFHQSLDLLWVVNGVVFFALLFATGQWMRIVPTSWEVFPNAVSAAIQYASFNWPTENGWVHYNALQQLAYFLTVFVAAPLAIATGARMSSLWPKDNQKLNAAYPAEIARKVHFPVMLFFVLFIVVHVLLVFLTGALRNLNHMFAAQGSADPSAYASNWMGLIMLLVAVAVTAGAWFAARPMVLSPIASAFGEVTTR